jgi:hypothetical protein
LVVVKSLGCCVPLWGLLAIPLNTVAPFSRGAWTQFEREVFDGITMNKNFN